MVPHTLSVPFDSFIILVDESRLFILWGQIFELVVSYEVNLERMVVLTQV